MTRWRTGSMPRVNIYIRKEDEKLWKKLKNK